MTGDEREVKPTVAAHLATLDVGWNLKRANRFFGGAFGLDF